MRSFKKLEKSVSDRLSKNEKKEARKRFQARYTQIESSSKGGINIFGRESKQEIFNAIYSFHLWQGEYRKPINLYFANGNVGFGG